MAHTALVTGATSGIGEALCLLLASDGYDLVTVARDGKSLDKQAHDLRLLDIDVLPVSCDLSHPDAARTIFKRVREAGKEIDILVNDAGYSPAGSFSELSVADIRAMIQVSVTSLAELTSVFLQPMLERGHGRILNMSSMMAKTPCPYNALYGAAKVFVLSFSTALARELHGTGVSVTTVCPGATRTNFSRNAGIEGAPAWKYFSMSADETAIRVYRALMRGERCAVTGWVNKVGALGVRFMPMGFQLRAGEWLLGTRKHPLGHEGTPEGVGGAHDGGSKGVRAERAPGGASGKACGCGEAGNDANHANDDGQTNAGADPTSDARANAKGTQTYLRARLPITSDPSGAQRAHTTRREPRQTCAATGGRTMRAASGALTKARPALAPHLARSAGCPGRNRDRKSCRSALHALAKGPERGGARHARTARPRAARLRPRSHGSLRIHVRHARSRTKRRCPHGASRPDRPPALSDAPIG